jgi:glycosyltransferase involved in cell wall biosynthesis
LRLAIDASGVKHTGGARVLLDFLGAAQQDERIDALFVFLPPSNSRVYDVSLFEKVHVLEEVLPQKSYVYRAVWWENLLGKKCSSLGIDRLFCIAGSGRGSDKIEHVTLIQQSLPFSSEFAKMMNAREHLRYLTLRQLMRRSCQSARRVIVQSEVMKSLVSDRFSLDEDRVQAIVPAPTGLFVKRSRLVPVSRDDHAPVLLYVGTADKHKNLVNLFAGMQLLWAIRPNTRLVLTLSSDEVTLADPRIQCIGRVPFNEIEALYATASLLVMPSIVETVGLPGLEAMALGLPVLAADRPYAREMYGDAALFFDPLAPMSFAQTADEVLKNVRLQLRMSETGLRLIASRQGARPYARMVDAVVT